MVESDALQIDQVPVESLIPRARNPRTHSDAQVAQLAASIREFGWTGRLLAARLLGMAHVPAIRLAGLTRAQKRALVIADNKLAMNAGWDDDLLRLELTELRDEGFALDLTGFGELELGVLLLDSGERGLPSLPDGDRPEFQQMTFTLHDSQAEQVKRAVEAAKGMGDFVGPNENGNGNALARVCEFFLADHGDG